MDYTNLCIACFSEKGEAEACSHCGYAEKALAASLFLTPRSILAGKYMIGKVLGQGGFGITYLGWDSILDLKLAVKEFFPMGLVARSAGTAHVETYAGDQGAQFHFGLNRFLGEAKTLARFSEHPNIVTVRKPGGRFLWLHFYSQLLHFTGVIIFPQGQQEEKTTWESTTYFSGALTKNKFLKMKKIVTRLLHFKLLLYKK